MDSIAYKCWNYKILRARAPLSDSFSTKFVYGQSWTNSPEQLIQISYSLTVSDNFPYITYSIIRVRCVTSLFISSFLWARKGKKIENYLTLCKWDEYMGLRFSCVHQHSKDIVKRKTNTQIQIQSNETQYQRYARCIIDRVRER